MFLIIVPKIVPNIIEINLPANRSNYPPSQTIIRTMKIIKANISLNKAT